MTDEKTLSAEEKALRARLDSLSGALEKQAKERARPEPNAVDDIAGKGFAKALNLGFRVLSEFVAGIIVGALIGWQLDKWLGISPAMLILFTMLGTAAGFWNVYRIAAKPTGKDPGSGRE